MKLIFKIARTELRNLFYSPVAWFLFIAFLVQAAFFYTAIIEALAKMQTMMMENATDYDGFGLSVTKVAFLAPQGIYANAINNLYLFLPLLTMGLISREINNGTIKLLYSSPVKTRHIVFGKFLALTIYNLLLIGVLGIFMILGLLNIKNVDTGLVLSATLAFYLLVCAYGAIGMFMSSLTTYQIVSAVATFMIIFLLGMVGGLWQQYDFVRDLTYFLAMGNRTGKMIVGLITTKDVIYFLLITTMFLSFTLFKLRGGREFTAWYKKAARYIGVIIVVLAIGYLSSRPGLIGYWDTTRDNLNTIHPRTQGVIGEFEKNEPLEVTIYGNLLDLSYGPSSPVARNSYLWDFWEKYVRFKPDIKFRYEYYYDVLDVDSAKKRADFQHKTLKEIAAVYAEGNNMSLSRFKSPAEIRKTIDLQPEGLRTVMQLKYKGKTTFLRTYPDSEFWPNEMNVSAAFKRLLQPEMPKVLYTTGNLERDIYKFGEREYNSHSIQKLNRNALVNLGFDADTISPDLREIPAGITALVVADPKTKLSTLKEERIKKYLADGGNAFIMGEPGKQQMLNPLLSALDTRLEDGTLVEVTQHEMPHMLRPYFTKDIYFMSDAMGFPYVRPKLNDPKFEGKMPILMPGAAAVETTGKSDFTFNPLLITSKGVFNRTGKLVVDSVPPVFTPSEGDTEKTPFVSMATLRRKIQNKEQRIIVAGDADYMSNMRMQLGIPDFVNSFFSWMDNNEFPVYTPKPGPIDKWVTISDKTAKAQTIFFVWILPALVLLLGTVMLIRRKRK